MCRCDGNCPALPVIAMRSGPAELSWSDSPRLSELEEGVARLERLTSRNSGNSSMPPSSDDLPGKKPPGRKPRRHGGVAVRSATR
jgi:Family of unknown function (DUF6444)